MTKTIDLEALATVTGGTPGTKTSWKTTKEGWSNMWKGNGGFWGGYGGNQGGQQR